MNNALACIVPWSIFLAFFSGGCASSNEASSGEPHAQVKAVESLSASGQAALAVLRGGGDFTFSLDESDPGVRARASCAAQAGDDATKADACYAAIRAQASEEGLRFAVDASGALVWTSRGKDNGVEITYLRAPIALASEEAGGLAFNWAASPEGASAAHAPADFVLHVQVPDANTVITTDAKKGRLVFHRARRAL